MLPSGDVYARPIQKGNLVKINGTGKCVKSFTVLYQLREKNWAEVE